MSTRNRNNTPSRKAPSPILTEDQLDQALFGNYADQMLDYLGKKHPHLINKLAAIHNITPRIVEKHLGECNCPRGSMWEHPSYSCICSAAEFVEVGGELFLPEDVQDIRAALAEQLRAEIYAETIYKDATALLEANHIARRVLQ